MFPGTTLSLSYKMFLTITKWPINYTSTRKKIQMTMVIVAFSFSSKNVASSLLKITY